jgi:formylglycine-generating enzyme required for sulfatase activity
MRNLTAALAVTLLAVAFALIAAPRSANAAGDVRVALVIGNSSYQHTQQLKNPVNDARAIAATLRLMKFDEVDIATDLGKTALERTLQEFSRKASRADIAVVYYAGHGMALDGVNYLVPVDARLQSDTDVDFEAVRLELVLQSLTGARRLRMVFLDACRNNPLLNQMSAKGRRVSRGLVPVDAGNDSVVSFATKEGAIAEDGDGDHSPFAAALIRNLPGPDEARIMLGKVRDDVLSQTGQRQNPYVSQNMGGRAVYLGSPTQRTVVGPRSDDTFPQPTGMQVRPRPGATFKDCESCPEMVVVPAGSFTMGSPATEERSNDDERPQHRVTIQHDFAVGKFEVTFAEWDACVAGGGCNGYRPADQGWGRATRPVINVNWGDAQAYVAWLRRQTGKGYRLLSEAEWEYAARAGSTSPFSFGNTISSSQANYNGNYTYNFWLGSRGIYREKTVIVGSFQGNRFGLHDMHGNVWEWTEDCSNESYKGAPTDGGPWIYANCSRRALRGGSWVNGPQILRSACRYGYLSSNRSDDIGFRLARTL